jgi:glutathione S-transferase
MYPDVGFGFGGPGAVGAVEGTEAFVPAAKAAAAAQLLELLEQKFANGWLKDSPFLAGDKPTIADFRFGPVLLFARVAVILPEKIEQYLARLDKDVPGYADAVEPARAFVADKIKK